MSIVIALLVVIIVGTLVAKFYPTTKSKSPLAQGEILIPDAEELMQESGRVIIPETPQPKKRGPKPKPQGAPKTMAAKKPKKKVQ